MFTPFGDKYGVDYLIGLGAILCYYLSISMAKKTIMWYHLWMIQASLPLLLGGVLHLNVNVCCGMVVKCCKHVNIMHGGLPSLKLPVRT